MARRTTQWLRLLLAAGSAVAWGGCSRASSSAPDAAVPAESHSAAISSAQATSQPEAAAPAPLASALPAASSSATLTPAAPPAEDCAAIEKTTEYQNLPAEARGRSRMNCEAKQELRSYVAERQRCAAATDCSIVMGSCPFGCYIPVAKASASELTAKLSALGSRLDQAGHRCVYRCMAPPAAACVEGRCSAGHAEP
jgi:hypothetical protein